MRFLKFLALTLVVALGFSSCNPKDKHDHSADIVGTWTCFTENYAEALIINADGTAVSYGVEDGEYWENVRGTVVTEGDNITMTFEDDDNLTGHFDIIPGQSFSLFEDSGERYIYQYCENDLADEIIGMWVCTQIPIGKPEDMLIQTFQEDGTFIVTGRIPEIDDYVVVGESNYKVFGDLYIIKGKEEGKALVFKFNVASNASDLGDMMAITGFMPTENGVVEETSSWLRVKENLNLTGNKYAYKSAYVSNAKGTDEDLSMLGHTFNMANIGAVDFDVVFCADLYIVELNAESITHKFRPNGQDVEVVTPITVEGNKVTLDYSAVNPSCRKVEMYMFQDKDDTQLHMYMPTASFVNYFANLWLPELIAEGELDPTDAAAVEKVYKDMEARVESINVSFVMKALK